MTEKKTKQGRVKRWMKICGGMVVAIVLFFLLMPFGVKFYLADWLEKNGADSATIQSLRFNPFKGQVTLGEMDVQLGGRSIIQNSSVVLDVSLTSLFNQDVRVEKAEYNNFSIDLERLSIATSLLLNDYRVHKLSSSQTEKLIKMLNRDLADEHATIIRYLIHSYLEGEDSPLGAGLLSRTREEM